MRFFRLYSFFVVSVLALILSACSDDDDGTDYPFDREVMELSVLRSCGDKADSGDACYRLRFRYPIETERLEALYLWLDTSVVDDTSKNVSSSQRDKADSVIEFVRKDGKTYDTIDLTGMIKDYLKEKYDSLQVAIFCKYSKGDPGAVQRLFLHFGDDQQPSLVSIRMDSIWTTGAVSQWYRPTDQTDYYSPAEISGPIVGYNVVITAANKDEDLRKLKISVEGAEDTVRYARIRFTHDSIWVDTTLHSSKEKNIFHFVILDGQGFDMDNDSANLFVMSINGLKTESRYTIGITSWDSSGNSSVEVTKDFFTTDSIAPLIATSLVTIEDTLFPGTGLAALDSNNRLRIFWSRAVDPLVKDHGIKEDTVLLFPSGCGAMDCYDTVASYDVMRFNPVTKTWDSVAFAGGSSSRYNKEYDWDDGYMSVVDGGRYVTDTIRWVVPGDTLILRIRARDASGYYSHSLIDTVYVSPSALANELECPEGFVAVSVSDTNKFCMEKFEHRNDSGEFVTNVLHSEAAAACEAMSASGFKVSLCKERDWELVCLSEGRLNFGVVEDDTVSSSEFLFRVCNIATNDSTSATNVTKRNYRCINPMGVHDMPGQLQEWVMGRSEDSAAVLKGASYKVFNGLDIESIARCTNRSFPFFTRVGYTQDTVYLYREGTRVDTVFEADTSRTLYAKLTTKDFKDSVQFFDVQDSSGNSVGVDYAPYAEYKKGGEEWLKSVSNGLVYVPDHVEKVFFTGEKIVYRKASSFYRSPSVGFRCCAYPEADSE